MRNNIERRQLKNKQDIVEQLKKTPIVQFACERTGISRATYYRWRKEDGVFLKESDQALEEGSLLINDMAESQLMSAIKDKNMTAIIFWLKHHHPKYTTSIQITGAISQERLSQDEINELAGLLYNQDTFRKGQELLTAYVFNGKVSEKFAELIIRMFMSRLRAEDIFTRKAESDIMTEVLFRKDRKNKKYG